MLQPKRTKFRKVHKGRNTGLAHRGSTVSFGSIAIKATERGRMTARQIEAARRTAYSRINQLLKSLLKCVWVKVRVAWNTGFARSNQVRSCTKLKV